MSAANGGSDAHGNASASGSSEQLDHGVFINPLSAGTASTAIGAGAIRAQDEQDQPALEQPAPPQQRADDSASAAAVAAQKPAQPEADADADASEAHALLPPRHADSAAAAEDSGITPHHGGGSRGHALADSDAESVSLDSPAAGRPPGGSAAAMTNPYWQIDGAMRNLLAEQAPVEAPSSKGHQVG